VSSDQNSNGWNEYSKLVLTEIQDLKTCTGRVQDDITSIKTQVEILKVKSSIWGGFTGAITGVVSTILTFMTVMKFFVKG
jgi:hypothetical protein